VWTFNERSAFSPILRNSSLFHLRDAVHRVARNALFCAKSITKSQELAECPHALAWLVVGLTALVPEKAEANTPKNTRKTLVECLIR
jgi:hypothetical protein